MKIIKSINSARGYWADDLNAENNNKILQTLAKSLYDNFDSSEIDGVTIYVDDVVRSTATDGAYKIWVNIDPADYRDELTLEIVSTPDGRGKFICRVYDFDMIPIDEFTIRMSGCKQAVIDKINELVAGINNSQGVESSMKIRRNRVIANKRRAVKASGKVSDSKRFIWNKHGDNYTFWVEDLFTGKSAFVKKDLNGRYTVDGCPLTDPAHYTGYPMPHKFSKSELLSYLKEEFAKDSSPICESKRCKGKSVMAKANTYGDMYEDIERSKDAYIDEWQRDYNGTPNTSWDNIFDNVLDEFKRYCEDEASAEDGYTVDEYYRNGEYNDTDVLNVFDGWVLWLDLNDYDY